MMIYLAINCTSSLECKTPYYWGFTMWETLVIYKNKTTYQDNYEQEKRANNTIMVAAL